MPSTVIAWYHYDRANLSLLITFLSGAQYIYKKVPPAIYKEFSNSLSKGAYFNRHIKDVFIFEKIENSVTAENKGKRKNKTDFKS